MTINPDTGRIEWTPSGAQSGYYYVTVKVDDGRCGEATQRYWIYVNSNPTTQFTVDPCSGYNPGGNITLTWSTTRASTVLIDQGIGEVAANGSLTIPSPDTPTVYTMTAFNDAALVKTTAPGSPWAQFYFSPSSILNGQSTTLYWNPQCFTSASIDHGIGEVNSSGSMVITPTATSNYYMTVGNASYTRTYRATVSVREPPPPPSPSVSFYAAPLCNFTPNEPLTLTWSTSNATSISISPDIGVVAASGSLQVYPSAAGSYTLTATGPGGTRSSTVSFPNYPSLSFSSSAYGIDLGNPATLFWSSSCADTVTINQSVGEVALSGNLKVTPDVLPVTYIITATNEGGSRTRSVRLYQIAPYGSLTANPTTMKVGDNTTLTWTSSRAISASITPDIGPVALNGSMTITPTKPTQYRLTVQGLGGTHSSYANVGFVQPMADLKSSATTINQGETVKLTWIFTNATSSVINQGIGEVELGGERTVAPAVSTKYTMTATGPGGTAIDSVTINVIPSDQPPIVSLSASPSIIMRGDSTVISWESSYTDTLTIEPGIGNVVNSDSQTVSPEVTTTYTATATGPGGTIITRSVVTVMQQAPSLSLVMDPASVNTGGTAVLSWTSSNVDTVVFDQGIGAMPPQGSVSLSPDTTTLYTATATGPGGTLLKHIALNVIHPAPTVNFSASPISIMLGESTTLSWSTENAETVTIRPSIEGVELNGSMTVSPTQDTTYIITVTGIAETITSSVDVEVYQTPTATLTIVPDTIIKGDTTQLTWRTEHADSCEITPDIGEIACNGNYAVMPNDTTTYAITATGPGGTANDTATVTVTIPNPITLAITSHATGDMITRPDIMITGTVNHANGLETGVVVNGVTALVYNGIFVANDIPMEEGEDTIVVLALPFTRKIILDSSVPAVYVFWHEPTKPNKTDPIET
jgi:hypothetical protein